MGDWRIAYSERPLGVGVHDVIEVIGDDNKVVRSFEGLAADASGKKKAIGSERLGDIILSHMSSGKSANALEESKTVYTGSRADVESAMRAMEAASKAIDAKRIPYQLPLVDSGFSAPTNSNSYIATMFAVMGLKKPPPIKATLMGQVGAGKMLLDPEEIAGFHGMIGAPAPGNVPLPPRRPATEIDAGGNRAMNGTGPVNAGSPSVPLYLRMPEIARKLYPSP